MNAVQRPRINTSDVFVGNLPENCDEEDIKKVFSEVGEVHSVLVKEGKNNSNYCFVRYITQEAADLALVELNGKFFHGKTLSVKTTIKKGNKPDGGGGGVGVGGGTRNPVDARRFNQGQPRSRQGGHGGQPACGGDQEEWRQWSEEVVAITHVADCITFYAQLVNEEAAIAYQQMIQQLHAHCPTALPATNVQLNQLYGAVYSQDECWYRCTIIQSITEPGQVLVRFVDFGNEEKINSSDMVELTPELCSTKVFAMRMTLYGLDNVFADKQSENAKQAVKYLTSLADAESVTVKVKDIQVLHSGFNQSLPVVLVHDDIIVNQYVKTTLADRELTPPPIQSSGAAFQQMGRPNTNSQNYSGWNAPPHMGGQGDGADMIMIQLQSEKAELIQKVHNMKLDMEVLKSSTEVEIKGYRENVDQALNLKTSTVFASLQRVRKARKLYSLDGTKKAPLEEAIALVVGGEVQLGDQTIKFREATPDVNEVENKLDALMDNQTKLKECQSKESLQNLILERNEARQVSFQSMTNFLKVSDQLPIDERLSNLQNTLETVRAQYPAMVEPLISSRENPQDVYQQYSMWMDLKVKKLHLFWSETDACLDAWTELLLQTTQAFSLDSDTSFEANNIDQTLQNLYIALETELVVTCLGYAPEVGINHEVLSQRKTEESLEQDILHRTVQALIADIQSEIKFLGNLSTHCRKYKEKSERLEVWLNDKPAVEGLQALQKKIKIERSKLRHLFADLKDGEEDPDLLGDKTVEELKTEIGIRQQKLWDHYKDEDENLSTLSELTREHFPELPVLYPTLGLKVFMETNGLVREGRDLKHFNLSPLPMCDKNTVKVGSINSKEIVLVKSHHVSDDHIHKSLMNSVLAYHAIKSSYLLPISGVNYQRDLSHLHIQITYHPLQSLSHFMTGEDPLSVSELLPILKTVLLGLNELHNRKVLHCAVQPNNVILKSRTEVLLADYDLSKTTSERAKQVYTAANGLCFTAPEINCGLDPSPATDVFAFGVLVLWAHYPTSPFQTSPDGTPHLEGLPIPAELCNFLAPLLNYNPNKRPQISDILAFGYFDRLPEPQSLPAEEPSYQDDEPHEDGTNVDDPVVTEETSSDSAGSPVDDGGYAGKEVLRDEESVPEGLVNHQEEEGNLDAGIQEAISEEAVSEEAVSQEAVSLAPNERTEDGKVEDDLPFQKTSDEASFLNGTNEMPTDKFMGLEDSSTPPSLQDDDEEDEDIE